LVLKNFPFSTFNIFKQVPVLFRLGLYAQLANLFQLMNYRLSYYFLDSYGDRSMVGIYSVGVSIAESVWLISASIALVLYTRMANTKDYEYMNRITILMSKFSLMISFLAMLILLCIPNNWFMLLFGNDFVFVKKIILLLAPGILSFSFSMVLSHYFSGLGKYHLNMWSSLAGFITTILLSYLLIPSLGYVGAAITASSSYLLSSFLLSYKFIKYTKCKWMDFMITPYDFILFFQELKTRWQYVRNSRNN